MDLTQTVERLVRELLRSIPTDVMPSPQVLYVLDDSQAADRYLDHFVVLKQAGIRYDLLVLDGENAGWLGKQCIESTGAGNCIAMDEQAPSPTELPQSYAAIIVPELDLDQASRILHGILGSVESELVQAGLILGKPVFTRIDGSGMTQANRRTLQVTGLPPAYERRYRATIQQLQELGMHIASFQELPYQVVTAVLPGQPEHSMSSPASTVFSARLLTASDAARILQSNRDRVVTVARGTLISPLARDVIRDQRAELRIVDEVTFDGAG
ncbi:hypothetical protein BVG16_05940 [Paenibacillus selenitireducens]|uniref:Ethanolamine utilization protein n=1 Tax=Paenibacillus selenitireducens TaxID=1324314 RepID=A0A1T2XK96_9BACL|nr:hypothetical protein [Paenibacillus selenitireducens]OPA80274.1 hypothetical protein BVG16_05940 [Paenibacillus selenitireducens]